MKKLRLTVHAGQRALLKELSAFGEHPEIQTPAEFKIFNFIRCIEALGTHKAQTEAMQEGSLVLKIDRQTLRITVKDGTCTAVPTKDAPELSLHAMEAAAALTTHFGALYDHPLLTAWTPLCPLSIPHCDEV